MALFYLDWFECFRLFCLSRIESRKYFLIVISCSTACNKMFYWLTLDGNHCLWSFSTRKSCLILNWNHSLLSLSVRQISLRSTPLLSFSHHLLSLALKICNTNLLLGFSVFLCRNELLYSRYTLSRLIALRIFFRFILVLWSDWCSWHVRIISIKSWSLLFSTSFSC